MNTSVGGNALLNDADLNADTITAVFVDGTAVPVATSVSVPTPNGGVFELFANGDYLYICLLYTSPSPRDRTRSRMPSSA